MKLTNVYPRYLKNDFLSLLADKLCASKAPRLNEVLKSSLTRGVLMIEEIRSIVRFFLLATIGSLCFFAHMASAENVWQMESTGVYDPARNGLPDMRMWGSAADDVFSVGYDGRILHYDGNSWTQMVSGTAATLWDIHGVSSSNVYAVGRDLVLHYDGSAWSDISPPLTNDWLECVWAASPTNIFVGSNDERIWHYDGSNWTLHHSVERVAGYKPYIKGLWGTSATDMYAVVYRTALGTTDEVMHYDGNSWATIYTHYRRQYLRFIWGSSGSDLFVGGHGTEIKHYNGSTWSSMNNTLSGVLVRDLWGLGPDDVFAVGQMGRIAHYSGTSWQRMNTGTCQDMMSVWGSSPNDVWACGAADTLLHYGNHKNPLAGTWNAISITGNGTYSFTTQKPTSGTIYINVTTAGDIPATFNYVAKLNPADETWYGTSALISGTVDIDGTPHPADLWLKGDMTSFNLFLPTAWNCTLSAKEGMTHGYTTDGSEISADFGWSGACSGALSLGIGTWTVTSGSGSGTWAGVATECLGGKTEFAGSGSGSVSVAASPTQATITYDFAEDGEIILAKYASNPGGIPTNNTLHKYIQVDSNVTTPDIAWSNTELRIYYTDVEAALSYIDEETFKMCRWDGTNWNELAGCGVNTESNYVWGSLTSFSVYSIQGHSTFYTCDSNGVAKTHFEIGETVYVTGSGLGYDTDYNIWIQDAPVADGDSLVSAEDPSGVPESVTTSTNGTLAVTAIWTVSGLYPGDFQVTLENPEFGGATSLQTDNDFTGGPQGAGPTLIISTNTVPDDRVVIIWESATDRVYRVYSTIDLTETWPTDVLHQASGGGMLSYTGLTTSATSTFFKVQMGID